MPTAIKDLNLTAGVRTTFGSAAYTDHVPDLSDAVTLAIEAAGMVSLGKTNTPEFGSPCYTEPDVAPPAVTPWDTSRMAGGSSGGAAAAVAAGLVPVAQGVRRRWLDPHPRIVLRDRRAQAEPRAHLRRPDVRRPRRAGDGRTARAHGP